MPTYVYECVACEQNFTKIMKIAERHHPCDVPCEQCGGQIKNIISAPKIVSGVKTPNSAPDGFKDVLRTIKKGAGKESTIDV